MNTCQGQHREQTEGNHSAKQSYCSPKRLQPAVCQQPKPAQLQRQGQKFRPTDMRSEVEHFLDGPRPPFCVPDGIEQLRKIMHSFNGQEAKFTYAPSIRTAPVGQCSTMEAMSSVLQDDTEVVVCSKTTGERTHSN
eukprot:5269884-Amphidinium_carterae.4